MRIWNRLLRPWWRPVLLALDLLGLAVAICGLAFGWPAGWLLPFLGAVFVSGVLTFRELWKRSEPISGTDPTEEKDTPQGR
jgi:hypothetical protein